MSVARVGGGGGGDGSRISEKLYEPSRLPAAPAPARLAVSGGRNGGKL